MGELKKPADTQRRTERATEYFRGVLSELKKVHWPSRTQLLAYTGVVFVAVVIISILLWIADSGLSAVLNKLLP